MDLDSALTGKPAEGASATDILRADHREAERLFAEYREARSDPHAGGVIAQSLCIQLELHDAIERDVLYPTLREVDAAFLNQALQAHDEIAHAVERLRSAADSEEPLDDAIRRLESLVTSHIEQEEEVLFPRLESQQGLSLADLGRSLIHRKEELTRSTESLQGPAT